jgi:hypothetical protein
MKAPSVHGFGRRYQSQLPSQTADSVSAPVCFYPNLSSLSGHEMVLDGPGLLGLRQSVPLHSLTKVLKPPNPKTHINLRADA